MTRTARIAAATVGLAVFGAIAGGIAAYLAHALSFVAVMGGEVAWPRIAHLLLNPIGIARFLGEGAKIGMVLGPVVGWGLMRRVPLGWVALGLGGGAFAGGVAGWVAGDRLPTAIWGAAAGMLLAAAVLRVLFRPRSDAPGATGDTDSGTGLLMSRPELLASPGVAADVVLGASPLHGRRTRR